MFPSGPKRPKIAVQRTYKGPDTLNMNRALGRDDVTLEIEYRKQYYFQMDN